jgi:hypothetical protein
MDLPLLRMASKGQNGGGREGHHSRQGGESNGTLSVLGIDMAKWMFHIVGMDDTRCRGAPEAPHSERMARFNGESTTCPSRKCHCMVSA